MREKLLKQLLTVLVLSFFSASCWSHDINCDSEGSLNYCWRVGENPQKTVVFIHGIGNTHWNWEFNSVTVWIDKYWKGKKRPNILSLSYGPNWWYVNKDQGDELTTFVKSFLKRQNTSSKNLYLYGDSMGAHNSFRWAVDSESGFFSRLALICPAFVNESSPQFQDKERTGAWPLNDLAFWLISGAYSSDVSENSSILIQEQQLQKISQIDQVYVALTPTDFWGFYQPGKDFTQRLQSYMGDRLSVEEQDVVHCNMNPQKLSDFLIN